MSALPPPDEGRELRTVGFFVTVEFLAKAHKIYEVFVNLNFIQSLKALVVKNSVLHDFGFGKVSRIHETFLMELQLFGWRHFSKTEVVQNTVLNH